MRNKISEKIARERRKQIEKWGIQNHHPLKWLAILVEEVGEAAEMCNELTPVLLPKWKSQELNAKLEKELVQTAAVCVAWLESLEFTKKLEKSK